jgi:hypothetical protein
MPWFKVDDNLALHAKVLTAGNGAMGLWVRAGAWSMQQLTDGFVPNAIAATLGTKGEAGRLVSAGLWDQKDDGYQFHEWEQRQPSRVQLHAERDAAAERKRKSRERRESEKRGVR